MKTARIARRIASFLEEQGARFAVIGGWALLARGIQRATFDLDLVVERRVQGKLIEFLEDLGYRTLHRSTGYSNHAHDDVAMGRVDFVYVDEATADRLFGGCEILEVMEGLRLPVPRPEDLAAMKVHAMVNDPARRLRELGDVRDLLDLDGVDRAEVRGHFERRNLADLFDRMLGDVETDPGAEGDGE